MPTSLGCLPAPYQHLRSLCYLTCFCYLEWLPGSTPFCPLCFLAQVCLSTLGRQAQPHRYGHHWSAAMPIPPLSTLTRALCWSRQRAGPIVLFFASGTVIGCKGVSICIIPHKRWKNGLLRMEFCLAFKLLGLSDLQLDVVLLKPKRKDHFARGVILP